MPVNPIAATLPAQAEREIRHRDGASLGLPFLDPGVDELPSDGQREVGVVDHGDEARWVKDRRVSSSTRGGGEGRKWYALTSAYVCSPYYPVEVPVVGNTFEVMRASFLEAEAASGHQALDRLRDQHLRRTRE